MAVLQFNRHADHRWVISGTPTPIKAGDSLSHLRRLLEFIQEPPFCCIQSGRQAWNKLIREPFAVHARSDAVWLLRDVLSSAMVHHPKIENIVKSPKVELVKVELSDVERSTYNASAAQILASKTTAPIPLLWAVSL